VAAVLADMTSQLAPAASGKVAAAQALYSVAMPRVVSGTVYVTATWLVHARGRAVSRCAAVRAA
jgi:hypothetical protein